MQARLERLPAFADPASLVAAVVERRAQQGVEFRCDQLKGRFIRAALRELPPARFQRCGREEAVFGGGFREREQGPGLRPQGAKGRRGESGEHGATLPGLLVSARIVVA